MKKEEVIQRICELIENVSSEVFSNQESADCFCDAAVLDHSCTSEKVIEFIEKAVEKAISKIENV